MGARGAGIENGDVGLVLKVGVGDGGAGHADLLREVDGVVPEGDRGHFFGRWEHCGHEAAGILRYWIRCCRHGRGPLREALRSTAMGGSRPRHMGGMGRVAELAALSNVAPGSRHGINIKSW